MTHKCAVGGCPNRSDTIIHYMLPEEPKRRSLWLQFIKRSKDEEENIPVSSRVCGEHFSQDDFIKVDLGFTTRLILNVDAVPTIYSGEYSSEAKEQEEQAAGGASDLEETCNITISSTVSLACVKEEPLEYEVSHVTKPQEEIKLASARLSVKQEDDEHLLCAETREGAQVRVKRESGRNAPDTKSRDDKCFSCSTCGQKFLNKGVLMQHESNHVEENSDGTHHCQQCGKSFALEASLKGHQKIHKYESSLMHKCTMCPRRFRYKGSLNNHMRQHRPQLTYKCPLCEDSYLMKAELSQHVKTAHSGCRLACNFCEKIFMRVDPFIKHINRHVVETPYYCSTCKVYQMTERGYLCHMRIHKKKQLLRMNAENGSKVDTEEGKLQTLSFAMQQNDPGIPPAPGSVNEPVVDTVNLQTQEGLQMQTGLSVVAESVDDSDESGTIRIVSVEGNSLPSEMDLFCTESSEDTDEMD